MYTKQRERTKGNMVHDQDSAEYSYQKNLLESLEALPSSAEPTHEQIVSMLELGHVVKDAPQFTDQVADMSRTNGVTYLEGMTKSVGIKTSDDQYIDKRRTITEHDALKKTVEYLEEVIASQSSLQQRLARNMLTKLTFIGEKEFQEATKGIAIYWKALLEANPDLQILVPIGRSLGQGESRYVDHVHEDGTPMVKSGQYVLEGVLSHYSNDEIEQLRGRLITTKDEITVSNPQDLKIILLDDWAVSGHQLDETANGIRGTLPEFASCIEVQLIAAKKGHITMGIGQIINRGGGKSVVPLPVRAYYKAHPTEETYGIHIAGSHSKADWGFSDVMERMRDIDDRDEELPPLVSIVPPYRIEK